MPTVDSLNSLLTKLGFPQLSPEGALFLFAEDETEVTLEHDPTTSDVYLLADFGPIVRMMRERASYRLLAANCRIGENEGARFEIDSGDRSLVLRLPLLTDSLDAERWNQIIERFRAMVSSWQKQFDAEIAASVSELAGEEVTPDVPHK